MTKIIYYCDLHQGRLKPPADETDVTLICQYALDLNAAIFDYAHSNNINDVIHGGDESTFVKGDLSHHYKRAQLIAASMRDFPANSLHRVIGNHEPINNISIKKDSDRFRLMEELGFKTQSYDNGLKVNGKRRKGHKEKNRIIIAQPEIQNINGQNIYSYDEAKTLKLIPPKPGIMPRSDNRPNLVYASHWALDRFERGYPGSLNYKGYGFEDNSSKVKERFAEYANGDMGRIISLHGHEHRFSMTEDLGFPCLVMPSISQYDLDQPDRPCGLFVEISDENPDGRLTVAFKKINLKMEDDGRGGRRPVANNDNYEIQDVDRTYMDRYFRPVLQKFG